MKKIFCPAHFSIHVIFFYGRGAGSFPTASAVLSDIEHTFNKRAYKLRKVDTPSGIIDDTQVLIEIYVRYTNDAIKRVLNFQSISEGYFSTEYNQVTGFIALQDLKSVAHLLHREKVSVIATGKRKLASVTNQRVLIASWSLFGCSNNVCHSRKKSRLHL